MRRLAQLDHEGDPGWWSGLHDLAFAALPVGLAEILLQDLARGVAWERGADVDGLGALERRQVLTAICQHLLGIDRGTGRRDNDRLGDLPPPLVRHADHRN